MALHDLEFDVDVDELRCLLLETTNDALGLADELADAVEQARPADARAAAANFRQQRAVMRRLRTLLRVEEGLR